MPEQSSLRQRMLRRLDDPSVGPPTLFSVSFLESTIVPIPIELALVPLMASAPSRLWMIAWIALAGTLAGAIAGYAVGYFFFESIGQWLVQWTDSQAGFETFKSELRANGFWVIVFVGISALPFKIASIGAGAVGFDFALFCLATFIARAPRYLGLAWLVHRFGRDVSRILKRHRHTALILTGLGIGLIALITVVN